MSVKSGVRVLGPCLLVLLSAVKAHATYSYSEVVTALQEWSARPSAEGAAQLRVVRIGTTVKGRAILMAVLGGASVLPLDNGVDGDDQGPWAAPTKPDAPPGDAPEAAPASGPAEAQAASRDPGAPAAGITDPQPVADAPNGQPAGSEAAGAASAQPAGDDTSRAAPPAEAEGDTEENTPVTTDGGALVMTLEPTDAVPPAAEETGPGADQGALPVLPPLPEGPRCVFVIGRQHGNEPAPTEATMRFLKEYAATTDPARLDLLRRVTFYVVPMLNADGAEAYERRNARHVDLNRDWVNQSQPETRAIVRAVRQAKPHLVVDLHELHPTDWTASFVEAMEKEAGASAAVGDACNAAIAAVVGPLRAQSTRINARPVCNNREPRLAHRYFAVRQSIPTILIETRRAGDVPLEARTAIHYAALQAIARYTAGEPSSTPPRVIDAWLERGSAHDYRVAQARKAEAARLARARAARSYTRLASRGSGKTSVAKKREALRKKLAARKRARARR